MANGHAHLVPIIHAGCMEQSWFLLQMLGEGRCEAVNQPRVRVQLKPPPRDLAWSWWVGGLAQDAKLSQGLGV